MHVVKYVCSYACNKYVCSYACSIRMHVVSMCARMHVVSMCVRMHVVSMCVRMHVVSMLLAIPQDPINLVAVHIMFQHSSAHLNSKSYYNTLERRTTMTYIFMNKFMS
jgi:hypothetical protein